MTARFGERDGSDDSGPAPVRAALSPREREVLSLVVDRYRNPDIAARLHISKRTVESHIAALMRKLGAANRSELMAAGGARRPDAVAARDTTAPPGAAAVLGHPLVSRALLLRGQSSLSRAQARRRRMSAAREVTWSRALCAQARQIVAQSGNGRSPAAVDPDEH